MVFLIKKLGYAVKLDIAEGKNSVTGSAAIASGLKTVVGCVAGLEADASIDAYSGITAKPSATAGSIDVKVWKPTSVSNPTPIAATIAKDVRWVAWGYK